MPECIRYDVVSPLAKDKIHQMHPDMPEIQVLHCSHQGPLLVGQQLYVSALLPVALNTMSLTTITAVALDKVPKTVLEKY